MSRKERHKLIRITISFVIFISALISENYFNEFVVLALFLITYLIIGYDIILKAFRNILSGKVFDENFLMTIATFGAFFLSEYAEGIAIMLFYQVGEFFQSYAVSKSRGSIASLMDIRPDYANKLVNNELIQVDPNNVLVDDLIVVKPGERIPLDGVIVEGSSSVDTSALTGESMPRDCFIGDNVISGCINLLGKLTIKVTKTFGQSTVSKILELVENASSKKSKSEKFISKFARYYTPIIVLIAVLIAFIPPLFNDYHFDTWIKRALTFIVISCPCALVISVPLSFFGGIGGASKIGVLIKGSNYLEALAKTEIVVFDKTGTLTKGTFVVTEINARNISQEELLQIAAYAEDSSNHPIALSIKKAYNQKINSALIEDIKEIAGFGIKAIVNSQEILAGNIKLMRKMAIICDEVQLTGSIIYIARDNEYLGYIRIEDEIKNDAQKAIIDLKKMGIKQTVMLTGDNQIVGEKVAQTLNLDQVYSELLPADKVEKAQALMMTKSADKMLAFVGDGINDAPVLAIADIGIAMGGLGSDAAIEAADIVIMTDEPSKIAQAIKISQKTIRIVRQNIVFALGVKFVIAFLGALGYASMWAAVFADVGVSVIAILNAIRALKIK